MNVTKQIEQIFRDIVNFLKVLRPGETATRIGVLAFADRSGRVLVNFFGEQELFNVKTPYTGFNVGDNLGSILKADEQGGRQLTVSEQPLTFEGYGNRSDHAHPICVYTPVLHAGRKFGTLAYLLSGDYYLDAFKGIVVACANYFQTELYNNDIIANLSQANKLLSDFIDFIPDACIIFDRSGSIVQINRQAAILLDTDMESGKLEIIGHSYTEFFDTKMLTPQKWFNEEMKSVRVDIRSIRGHKKKVYNTSSILSSDDGTIVAVINCLKKASDVQQLVNKVVGNQAHYTFEDIVHRSAEMEDVIGFCRKIADSTHPVLIESESGTGKELFAQAIHNASDRRSQPFVIVDCSSIPRELLESELFGYASGSFTGASKNGKMGKIALANKGTVFFDEIGELPLSLQAKFLRFLQFKTYMPVGSTNVQQADVRIIAATNRSLQKEIEQQNFRQDLYFRLNIFNVRIPPLRERMDDIPMLAEHFVDKYKHEFDNPGAHLTRETLEMMGKYDWPGNVRELENAMIRALALSSGEILPEHIYRWQDIADSAAKLPPQTAGEEAAAPEMSPEADKEQAQEDSGALNSAQREKLLILNALEKTGGNKLKAAQLLEVSRTTLYKKMRQFGLE